MQTLIADLKATLSALLLAGLFSVMFGFLGISKGMVVLFAVIVFCVCYLKFTKNHIFFKDNMLGRPGCSSRLPDMSKLLEEQKPEENLSPKSSPTEKPKEMSSRQTRIPKQKRQEALELV
jgi:hypothetical protein